MDEANHWPSDELLPFAGKAANAALLGCGAGPSAATWHRWRLTGVIGPDGRRVILATVKIGGRRFVARSALRAFVDALNERNTSQPSVYRNSTCGAEAALQRLVELGVK